MRINKSSIIIIILLFTVIGVLGIFEKVNANIVSSVTDENGTVWEYVVNEEGNARIYGIGGNIPENITIPSNVDKYKVVEIRWYIYVLWQFYYKKCCYS